MLRIKGIEHSIILLDQISIGLGEEDQILV